MFMFVSGLVVFGISAGFEIEYRWTIFFIMVVVSIISSTMLTHGMYTRKFFSIFIGMSLLPITFGIFIMGVFLLRMVTKIDLVLVLIFVIVFWALWLIPILASTLSNKLVEEIVSPSTRLGRGLMGLFYALAVVGGAGGSAIGRTLSKASRQGNSLGLLIFSVIAMIGGIVLHFMFIGQVWHDRDRFKQEELALKAEKANRD
jgi:hypothetical protein